MSFNLPTLLEDALVLDGEGLVEVVQHPELLLLSRLVLTHPEKNAHGRSWPFQWWRLRSCLILQQCLTDKSDPLHKETLDIIGHVSQDPEWLELEQSDESGKKSLATLWHLEVAHFYGAYYEVMKVKEHVDRAARFSDLSLVETGAMGRRTKFQKFDLAQLTLDIKVKANGTEAEKNGQDVIETDLPVDLKLDDDVRLDKIKFADPQNLEPVDISKLNQCVLIAYFTLKQRSQPRDELTREELMPYLNVILNNRNPCWALKSSALLFRSKLESYERRTIERCLMQVQTIVDHLNTEEHSLARTHFVYASRMPPIWDVEAQLCRLLQSLGSVKSALDIALKLHFWEDVIQCYHQLQLRHKAAEVIRQQLEKRETPLLYCMLGDATDDITHYEKALELSDNKSARAYRSLGLYFYYRQNYEKTVEYLQKSLDLNSFQMHSLLRLGYAAMQIENWAVGADAYRKYCAYESDVSTTVNLLLREKGAPIISLSCNSIADLF